MNIEIISIGDELLIGQTINTNASWMGEQLLDVGVTVQWVTTVGDNLDHLVSALKIAESRADVILMTGGLGPTHDDITKKVVTDFFGANLIVNSQVLSQVRELFERRGLPLLKVNEEQALVPDNATVIINDCGTAPGLKFSRGKLTLYVMPGVPSEMKSMMTRYVLADLKTMINGQVTVKRVLSTTGIAESILFERLGDISELEKHVKIAFLPSFAGVKMRLMAQDTSVDRAQVRLDQAEQYIRERVEPFIFSAENLLLEEVIARDLTRAKKTLSVAESCTGGLIANKFTNISGSSLFFERGVVSYSNVAKINVLGVAEDLIEKHGAVSAEVACAMAEGMRKNAQTDYAISTTGIAGPTGGTDNKPVGLVFIGYSDAQETVFEKHTFLRDRLSNKERFAQAALNLLRKKIQGITI